MDKLQLHTQDEVDQTIGAENKKLLFICYQKAWQRWEGLPARDRIDFSARSRASIIHDYAAIHAIKEFDGVPGVKIVDQRENSGYLAVIFDDVLVLRFKKFRDDGLGTCSIETQKQQQFAWQEPPLPGIPTATNLVVGYLLNTLETEISTVALTCNIGQKSLWAIVITGDNVERSATIGQLQPKRSSGPAVRSTSDESASEKRAVEDSKSD